MQDRLPLSTLCSPPWTTTRQLPCALDVVKLRLAKGDVLFHEGEPGEKLYLIESGKIKLGQTAADGRESLIAVLGAGRDARRAVAVRSSASDRHAATAAHRDGELPDGP